MASTLAMDHPSATFPAWASFLAPTTGQCTQAEPRPFLVLPISPTCTFVPSHPAVKVSCSSSLETEMSIPTSSAILAGAATLTVAGSRICAKRVASVNAFFRFLSPGTSKMIAPVVALRILTASMPTSASRICRRQHLRVWHFRPLTEGQSHRRSSRWPKEHNLLSRLHQHTFRGFRRGPRRCGSPGFWGALCPPPSLSVCCGWSHVDFALHRPFCDFLHLFLLPSFLPWPDHLPLFILPLPLEQL